jgi:peptide methionine sulfoxide reductase msrA/msrB
MKSITLILSIYIFSCNLSCSQSKTESESEKNTQMVNLKKLTREEERVIIHKGTETAFTGAYEDFFEPGTFACKQCGAELFRSVDKFDAQCGWPSFDDAIPGAVKQIPDADGRRTEITCSKCGGHMGHVFYGEGFTSKNIRHCVNSISMQFIPENAKLITKTDTAIFAGGCFWGVEYLLQQTAGVISTEVGYIGGKTENPDYKDVCSHTTGHAEAVQVVFDPEETSYETLAKLFFEIHDPTQVNRQGPDVGDQYRSEIFYLNEEQKTTGLELIEVLKKKGYKVATRLTPASTFWKAEEYHQGYYMNNGKTPYCHVYTKRF